MEIFLDGIARHAITTKPAMIQRILLHQSRSLASCVRSTPRTSIARLQPPRSIIAPVSRPVGASRWYATEPGAKKDDAFVESKETDGEATDPLKKDLEAKDREIIELKVGRAL